MIGQSDAQKKEFAEGGSGTDDDFAPDRLKNMLAAINSVPAYVQRSSVMLVLAPVVPHSDEPIDCQFSSWKQRGWCRLEAIIGCLVGPAKYMILVESAKKMSLFNSNETLTRDSVGLGEFACCSRYGYQQRKFQNDFSNSNS